MCGRFALGILPFSVLEFFNIDGLVEFKPHYNIVPTQSIPAILHDKDSNKRTIKMFHWGLIPSWAKESKIGSRLINARSETVSEKPSFRDAFKYRRCLIPTTGYYEWGHKSKNKQPYYIKMRDDMLFAFAGLWEHWKSGEEGEIESCTILTTDANDLMQPLHDRMPVILNPEDYDMWLDPDIVKKEILEPLLKSYPSEYMTRYLISRDVNNPRNDSPEIIQPL